MGVAEGGGAAVVGVAVEAGCRVAVAAGAGVRAADVAAALGAGVGDATTTGAAGVGLASGATTGPEVGVGRGLGRVEGGRLKRSRLGSVCGPLGVVCAAASAGSIAAPAIHAPARLQNPIAVMPPTLRNPI